MQQCLEETRKAEEAEKRRLEEVERQRKLEEAAMREKEAERERCAKELAEEEARRLAAAKAEKIRQQQADQQRKQRITEDSARKTTPAASSNEKEKHRDSAKTFEVEEAWQSVSKSSQTASQKVINPTKVAPWSAASSLAPTKEKSLKEIQEEEERLLRAEQAKQARLRKEQESASLQSSGTWSNASQHLQWNQPAQQSSAIKTSTKPAWGGAGVEQHKASSSPLFDGPSLQAANKVPSALPKKTATASGKLNNKATPVNNSTNLLASEKAAKRALGMCEDNNVFIEWVVQRLKQLSSSVEADVLARFIEGVENPDEVEDYVMGYLGDSKTVKEFVREFLQKRSDFRNRGQHAVKDDLSSARGAPLSGNGSGFSVVQGRKKKNKGARLIVDGSCLGFRATSDPNRVNQGEIETVALSPGQKR
ncbi:hypothetical protein KIN20_031674 [Parelaphostrongylus tenuis]|uniref:Uncharacterized protein n=1 Tax=Parelaphostrongylus tenuis TaxID=148309 RepID=A0AAD5WH64_PARTN|nr:hypothetical protein KIN20_031674 [Parelaphostrongylus tenuis]